MGKKAEFNLTPKVIANLVETRRGETFGDQTTRGLSIHIPATGKARFHFRMRERGDDGQIIDEREPLDYFDSNDKDSLGKARARAEELRALWRKLGGRDKRKATDTTALGKLLEAYEADRREGDPHAAAGKPLPKDWDALKGMIENVYADALKTPTSRLSLNLLLDCQKSYARARREEKNASLAAKGKPPVADSIIVAHSTIAKATQALKPVLQYAVRKGLGLAEVAVGLECIGGPRKNLPRTRYLLPGELQRAFVGMDGLIDNAGTLLRFLLLTGCRLHNAITMRWKELHRSRVRMDGKVQDILVWRIPKWKAKKGHLISIPIVGDTLAIVEQMRPMTEADATYVFPAEIRRKWGGEENSGGGNASKWQGRVYELSGTKSWHRHDLRRTHATYLGFLGIDIAVVARSLGHRRDKDGGVTRRHYEMSSAFNRLVQAHLTLQTLLRDIEVGRMTLDLQLIEIEIENDDMVHEFIDRYELSSDQIRIARDEQYPLPDDLLATETDEEAPAADELADIEEDDAYADAA